MNPPAFLWRRRVLVFRLELSEKYIISEAHYIELNFDKIAWVR